MEIQKNTFTVGKIRIDKDRLYSIGNVEYVTGIEPLTETDDFGQALTALKNYSQENSRDYAFAIIDQNKELIETNADDGFKRILRDDVQLIRLDKYEEDELGTSMYRYKDDTRITIRRKDEGFFQNCYRSTFYYTGTEFPDRTVEGQFSALFPIDADRKQEKEFNRRLAENLKKVIFLFDPKEELTPLEKENFQKLLKKAYDDSKIQYNPMAREHIHAPKNPNDDDDYENERTKGKVVVREIER